LKPRFLPEVRPRPFNYPVDIVGKWRGTNFSFITRYRSGYPENLGEELTTLDGLGPCGAGTHTLEEHVIISSLPERGRLLAGLLARLT
jgi:hypothetical protein